MEIEMWLFLNVNCIFFNLVNISKLAVDVLAEF